MTVHKVLVVTSRKLKICEVFTDAADFANGIWHPTEFRSEYMDVKEAPQNDGFKTSEGYACILSQDARDLRYEATGRRTREEIKRLKRAFLRQLTYFNFLEDTPGFEPHTAELRTFDRGVRKGLLFKEREMWYDNAQDIAREWGFPRNLKFGYKMCELERKC